MAEREVLWGWDLDDAPADDGPADDGGGPPGHDPITEPIPLAEDQPQDRADSESWDHPDERETSYARPFVERLPGSPISTLTFKPAPPPWYRTKPAILAFIAAAAVALVLAILPLVLRSPGAAPEQSPGVAPAPSTSAGPTSSGAAPIPSGAQPSLTGVPAPPPPPPPPPAPPPAPAQDTAPAYSPYNPAPRNSSPSEGNKPEVNVTRAPISVAPDVQAPPPGEAKVGEGRPRRGFW